MENLHGIKKFQPVAIHIVGNAAPVAVAYANMAAEEMVKNRGPEIDHNCSFFSVDLVG